MFETSIFLLITAFVTLPSLISGKTEKGGKILQAAIFLQGAFGLFLLVWMGMGLFGVLITSRELLLESNGIIFWTILFVSRVLALAAGFIFIFGLFQRLLLFSSSEELKKKCRNLFYKFVAFQTSVGFLCLIMGIWDIVYETQVFPVLKY